MDKGIAGSFSILKEASEGNRYKGGSTYEYSFLGDHVNLLNIYKMWIELNMDKKISSEAKLDIRGL